MGRRPGSFAHSRFYTKRYDNREVGNDSLTSYNNLHRFAVFTAVCTFLLIIAGGLVTSTQSGLSVPDWPNTYGHFMFAFPLDQMVGGIFYEHSHRMIASVVGFLTVILAIWLWKREERKWVRMLGVAALGSVLLQGLLGGLTVLFLLPTWISVSHATLAQTFFVIVSSIALFTSSWWRNENESHPNSDDDTPSILTLGVLTTTAIYIQLILGAIMRHMQAGLAVPDFPLAYGQIFPSLSSDAIAQYNQMLIQSDVRLAADGPITGTQIVIHLLHRYWALVVSVMIIWTSVRLLKFSSRRVVDDPTRRELSTVSKRLSRFAYMLLGLLCIQISLGTFTVLSRKASDITTAHVATGALLLVCSILLVLHTVKIFGIHFNRSPVIISAREATA